MNFSQTNKELTDKIVEQRLNYLMRLNPEEWQAADKAFLSQIYKTHANAPLEDARMAKLKELTDDDLLTAFDS